MFWILCILVFLTPIGWIGMISLAVSISMVFDAIAESRVEKIRPQMRQEAYLAVRMRMGQFESVQEAQEYLDERYRH